VKPTAHDPVEPTARVSAELPLEMAVVGLPVAVPPRSRRRRATGSGARERRDGRRARDGRADDAALADDSAGTPGKRRKRKDGAQAETPEVGWSQIRPSRRPPTRTENTWCGPTTSPRPTHGPGGVRRAQVTRRGHCRVGRVFQPHGDDGFALRKNVSTRAFSPFVRHAGRRCDARSQTVDVPQRIIEARPEHTLAAPFHHSGEASSPPTTRASARSPEVSVHLRIARSDVSTRRTALITVVVAVEGAAELGKLHPRAGGRGTWRPDGRTRRSVAVLREQLRVRERQWLQTARWMSSTLITSPRRDESHLALHELEVDGPPGE
jgi:hypothetical protein